MTSEQTKQRPTSEQPKRGPKRLPSWQGDLGKFRQTSPRDAVSEAVLALIRSGELQPGMRLPSEPQLVEMTGISRSSVREAIRSLEAIGLLDIRRGHGTFVRAVDAGNIADAQLLLSLDDREVLENLIEARSALEPTIARLAAERATDEDLQELRAAVSAMSGEVGSDSWRSAHLAFHKALVEATHNIVLSKMWSLIALFLKDSPLVTGSIVSSTPTVHQDLLRAIEAHDADAAVAAMGAHITDMRRMSIA